MHWLGVMRISLVSPPRSQMTAPGSTLSSEILAHWVLFLHHIVGVMTLPTGVVVLRDEALSSTDAWVIILLLVGDRV